MTTLNFNDLLDPTRIFLVAESKVTIMTCRRESQKIVRGDRQVFSKVGNMNFGQDPKPLGKLGTTWPNKVEQRIGEMTERHFWQHHVNVLLDVLDTTIRLWRSLP